MSEQNLRFMGNCRVSLLARACGFVDYDDSNITLSNRPVYSSCFFCPSRFFSLVMCFFLLVGLSFFFVFLYDSYEKFMHDIKCRAEGRGGRENFLCI
jgi:hypothetical protein